MQPEILIILCRQRFCLICAKAQRWRPCSSWNGTSALTQRPRTRICWSTWPRQPCTWLPSWMSLTFVPRLMTSTRQIWTCQPSASCCSRQTYPSKTSDGHHQCTLCSSKAFSGRSSGKWTSFHQLTSSSTCWQSAHVSPLIADNRRNFSALPHSVLKMHLAIESPSSSPMTVLWSKESQKSFRRHCVWFICTKRVSTVKILGGLSIFSASYT